MSRVHPVACAHTHNLQRMITNLTTASAHHSHPHSVSAAALHPNNSSQDTPRADSVAWHQCGLSFKYTYLLAQIHCFTPYQFTHPTLAIYYEKGKSVNCLRYLNATIRLSCLLTNSWCCNSSLTTWKSPLPPYYFARVSLEPLIV